MVKQLPPPQPHRIFQQFSIENLLIHRRHHHLCRRHRDAIAHRHICIPAAINRLPDSPRDRMLQPLLEIPFPLRLIRCRHQGSTNGDRLVAPLNTQSCRKPRIRLLSFPNRNYGHKTSKKAVISKNHISNI